MAIQLRVTYSHAVTSSMTSSTKNFLTIVSRWFHDKIKLLEFNTSSISGIIKAASHDYAFFTPKFGLFWTKFHYIFTLSSTVHPIIGKMAWILLYKWFYERNINSWAQNHKLSRFFSRFWLKRVKFTGFSPKIGCIFATLPLKGTLPHVMTVN